MARLHDARYAPSTPIEIYRLRIDRAVVDEAGCPQGEALGNRLRLYQA